MFPRKKTERLCESILDGYRSSESVDRHPRSVSDVEAWAINASNGIAGGNGARVAAARVQTTNLRPFFAMLGAYGWTRVFARVPRFRVVVLAASAISFALYLRSLYVDYPTLARDWFDTEQVRQIRETRTFPDRYRPVARAYYRMTVLGERCGAVRVGVSP